MEEDLDDPARAWQQVDAELQARHAKHLTPADWHALGRALGVARNTANNWRARKRLPAHQWQQIADYFGWTLDRLLGRQEPAPTGSQDEPAASHLHGAAVAFSRDDFVRIYDTLSAPETQLLARLMAAVGFVPGVTVEVIPRWNPAEPDSGSPKRLADGMGDTIRVAKRTRE